MGLKTYKATHLVMSAAMKLMRLNLRVSGADQLPDRPTMFVSNHFTRIETFLTPYALFAHTRRQVRALAMHSIFRSWYGKYIELLGSMSLRDPRRNITIIRELMTGREDWLIYPEGGLVKNKKLMAGKRLQLQRPTRTGPPHTGAAMMALKAEVSKRRYLDACKRGDEARRNFYERRYHLTGPETINPKGIVVVPVNLTFYPFRPGVNVLNRIVRRFSGELDPRLEEELQVEGMILLGGSEIILHFGQPIEVSDYLDRPTRLARKLVGMFSESGSSELALRRQARRLTDDSMRSIYAGVEINLDHLFCNGLMAVDREVIDAADFHRALYLTAESLARDDSVRVHPSLSNGIFALVSGGAYGPLDDIARFVEASGIARRENDTYIINRQALREEHDFHKIRLRNPVRVIANEMEPVARAISTLQRAIRLSPIRLRERTARELIAGDLRHFEREYEQWADSRNGRAKHLGEPFFLEASDSALGVVLVHGYLACPEQMRPLADMLHGHGMSVYGARLTGHGTSPRQLHDVTWNDWMDSVRHAHAAVRNTCDRVVLAGFSLGGVLALLMASEAGPEIDAVVSINAPLRLRDRRIPFVPAIVNWNRALRHLGLGDGASLRENHTESPGINYDRHCLEAVREVRRAVKACRRTLDRVRCPVLAIQAEEDPLVAKSSGRLILRELQSSVKILDELPFDRHLIVRGPGSDQVFEKVRAFIERSRPETGATTNHATS